jgi:hypothetical protein
MVIGVDAKIVIKRSTTSLEVPTVAPTQDHTDGSWSSTDIYSGEFYLNEADEKLYINVSGTIKELAFASGSSNTIYSADDTVGTNRVATLTDTLTIESGELILKGLGTGTDVLFRREMSNGLDRQIIYDNGQSATAFGTNAVISANVGNWNSATGFTTGHAFYAGSGSVRGTLFQHIGGGASPIGIDSGFQGSPTGTVTAIRGTTFVASGSNNIGLYGLARNGSSTSRGVFGQVVGGASVVPSGYVAAVEGEAGTNVDALSYGGRFTAAYANAALVYTKEMIAVYGRATVGNVGAVGSLGLAIGAQFSTVNSGGGATTSNMAINVPSTNNNGVVVFGADARSGDSILQVSGDIEILGTTDGVILEDRTLNTRHRIYLDNGIVSIEAA